MKQIYKIILPLILIISAFFFGKTCSTKPETEIVSQPENTILKQVISDLNKDKDSLLKVAHSSDTARITYIIKWRSAKARIDSLPCDSLVIICDTLLFIDSTEIANLKQVIKIDSSIIVNQKHLIENDSVYIDSVHKAIHKHMRAKKWLIDGRCRHFTKEVLK